MMYKNSKNRDSALFLFDNKCFKKWALSLFLLTTVLGIFFRFYHITGNQFIYYDEGMWLNQDRGFVELVSNNPPKNFFELTKILNLSAHLSLATAKSLWTFLSHLRGFIVGANGWYFTRLISAIFGSLTLVVIYFFTKKYYNSRWAGLLAVSLLAVFPSHVYYSRLGLQEAFSTFCFFSGVYWYLFPRKLHIKTFLSAILLSLVFFSNYRMIISPILIGFCALYDHLSRKENLDIQKYVWHTLTFLAIVFGVGNIDGGANTNITFAWMFHQADLAKGHFSSFNLLSYPYYLFRFESIFFGLLFFGNIYFVIKRQWTNLLPFALVCLMMGLFSLSQEKGVRYLCAVMPFMVMAVAGLIVSLLEKNKNILFQRGLIVVIILMFGIHLVKANAIAHFSSDYESSMKMLVDRNPHVKVLSTQPMVQKLYVSNEKNVVPVPHQLKHLIAYYLQGYRYLIIDPQVYISYTEDKKRFNPKLENYLEFIVQRVSPIKEYPHFKPALLERFVLEHNENLRRSLAFLDSNKDGKSGVLKVYDIGQCLEAIRKERM